MLPSSKLAYSSITQASLLLCNGLQNYSGEFIQDIASLHCVEENSLSS